MSFAFTVNGAPVEVAAAGSRRLLDVLREDLALTGTKEGCGEGECGACSVLLDGAVVDACLVPVSQAAGTDVRTVEGLGAAGALDALQTAFLQTGGRQDPWSRRRRPVPRRSASGPGPAARRYQARVDDGAIEEHGAGAAFALAASLLGAGEREILSKRVEQAARARGHDLDRRPVDGKCEAHDSPSGPGRGRASRRRRRALLDRRRARRRSPRRCPVPGRRSRRAGRR